MHIKISLSDLFDLANQVRVCKIEVIYYHKLRTLYVIKLQLYLGANKLMCNMCKINVNVLVFVAISSVLRVLSVFRFRIFLSCFLPAYCCNFSA